MGYQIRPSKLTPIKEAVYLLLLGNTSAGQNVYKNRPSPLWPIEVNPSAICIYFIESKADDRGQSFPVFYTYHCELVIECMSLATEGSDDLVELVAQEVKDILTVRRRLQNPISNEDTVDNIKFQRSKMELTSMTSEQVLTSVCLYFEVEFEEELVSLEPGMVTDLNLLSLEFNIDKNSNADFHPGSEISSLTDMTKLLSKFEPILKFQTSFETFLDHQNFDYVTPGTYGTYQNIVTEAVLTGKYSHKAWMYQQNGPTNDVYSWERHRGYITVQFHKTLGGVINGPMLHIVNVYADVLLLPAGPALPSGAPDINDWFSPATYSPNGGAEWNPVMATVTDHTGILRLGHVPTFDQDILLYQNESYLFQMKKWHRIAVFIDPHDTKGYCKMWLDGILVSYANLYNFKGRVSAFHGGLYCSPRCWKATDGITDGFVRNEDESFYNVYDEASAMQLIKP